ncbi:MAG: DUF5343 domain-containing protein [Roseitalea sp.]|jgi:hypothetical protein|nr:DUF5343 domain-containing protein [Roseitalea sp.]MBO6723370.1 DUF5343 domain-containing protein [Roseitalea sp.]MBO6745216.1 DUF5343 domain-containing protein [Roseitalea sp.]
MLTKRYLPSVKNLPNILEQMQKGVAPETFDYEHLKSIGFTSSNDRGVVTLLKDLGFLTENGAPTDRYREYRGDPERVLGEAILDTYGDLFHINATPTEADRPAIEGKFKAVHNSTDKVASLQAATFFCLLRNADISKAREESAQPAKEAQEAPETDLVEEPATGSANYKSTSVSIPLRYNIEIHLPATKDIEIYHAIFRSIRENLGE